MADRPSRPNAVKLARRGKPGAPGPRRSGPGEPQAESRGKPRAKSHRERHEPAGYAVRALAVRLICAVLDRRRALDDALAAEFAAPQAAALEPRDRGLARLVAATALRRKGELEAVVQHFIERPLPADRGLLSPILLGATAQLLVLEIPPHAVINIAVEQCRRDHGARRFAKLANAVLRRVCEHGQAILADLPGARCNVPDWLYSRWSRAYGETVAARIAESSLREAPLDLSVKHEVEAAGWADKLGGILLQTGTARVASPQTRVDALPGFTEGAWWVQDAAAALPARLLGNIAGKRVADLCAAPGGKTAQLAAAGAHVTAVDLSTDRLARVRENLARLKLDAEVIAGDVTTWSPAAPFDAVLLDAPCTATGTIRRHPDILHLKRPTDLAPLVELQSRMLDRAATLVSPGGTLVYCTCSLEPEEGERQIERFLARTPQFERTPIVPGESGIDAAWITPVGDLRTLPFHIPGDAHAASGMDGFFAARLVRSS